MSESIKPSWENRPTKDEYFMWMAVVASTRATCDRRSVGIVIVDGEGRVLSTGYNGSSPGAPHCDDIGHLMLNGRCVRTVHAEQNAIGFAARAGVSLRNSVAFVTCHPCPECLKLLITAGIRTVFYLEPYHPKEDDVSKELSKYGLVLHQYSGDRPWERPLTR